MKALKLLSVALAQFSHQPKHNLNQTDLNQTDKQLTLSEIPTDTFNLIINDLRCQGWKKISEYNGFDAWIDYGMVVLRKRNMKLKFEWDNWTEGVIHGPDSQLQEIKERYHLR